MAVEPPLPKRAPSLFSALQFRDFRLLWTGLLISNLGSWMQFTASGFFVVKLAGTPELGALYLGILGGARAVPVILFSPIAGVIADTWPRRRVLVVTNTAISALALLLAVLTQFNAISIWGVIAISMGNAIAQSFDAPARQSWVPLLVGRQFVGNAIGLNSVAFNAPAIIGPAIAGFLIADVSIAGSFYINAVATLAVVIAVVLMKPSPPSFATREPLFLSIRRGLVFLFEHPILKYVMLFFVVSALLVRPYSILLPAYALHYLHTGAQGLGWALAATGVGAFAGALTTAIVGSRESRGTLWIASGLLLALGVLVLGFIQTLVLAFPVLAIIGLSTMVFLGTSNILIQTLSPDEMRGRAISVYSMIALGFVPGGAFIIGTLGSLISLHRAFMLVGALCALFALYLWLRKPILRTV